MSLNETWSATLRHEAGHTVVGLHFGFSWTGAQIKLTKAGQVIGGSNVTVPDQPTFEAAVVAAAGPAAEAQRFAAPASPDEWESDGDKITVFLNSSGGRHETFETIRKEASLIVELHSADIDLVALRLSQEVLESSPSFARAGYLREYHALEITQQLSQCPGCKPR